MPNLQIWRYLKNAQKSSFGMLSGSVAWRASSTYGAERWPETYEIHKEIYCFAEMSNSANLEICEILEKSSFCWLFGSRRRAHCWAVRSRRFSNKQHALFTTLMQEMRASVHGILPVACRPARCLRHCREHAEQHATCNKQDAAYNVQHITNKIQHTIYNI